MSRKLALVATVVIPTLLTPLGGCIAVGGSDRITKPTLGRQLMDLKTAHETGAISQQEYEQAKSSMLSRA